MSDSVYNIDKLIGKLGNPIEGSELISRPKSDLDKILGLRYNWLDGCDSCWISAVDYMGNDRTPAKAARKSTKGGESNKEESFARDNGTTRFLIQHAHTSPLESCEMRIEITLPLFVLAQIVRHRTANVNVQSGRYSEFKPEYYIPKTLFPQSVKNKQMRDESIPMTGEEIDKLLGQTEELVENSFHVYREMIEKHNVAREMARFHLPQNLISSMSFKLDSHNLMHFNDLRLAADVMPETRMLAQKIEILQAIHTPMIHKHYVEYRRDSVRLFSQEAELIGKLLDGESVDPKALENLKEKIAAHKMAGALDVESILS